MTTITHHLACLLLAGLMLSPAVASDSSSTPGPARQVSKAYSGAALQENIDRLQIQHGPHSMELVQPLLELGSLQHENRRFADADAALERALYIHRVNTGLQDLSQLVILELMISNQIEQQDWKAANDLYHHYYWLQRRNYRDGDSRILAGLDKLIAWHLLATNLDSGAHAGEHFMTLLELNQRALRLVENLPERDDLQLAQRLYKLALVHYYIAIAVQRGAAVGQYLMQKFNPIQQGESYQTSAEKIALKRFRISRQLVARISALYENDSPAMPGSKAIARLYLADWDLLFSRQANAMRGYQLAYSNLLDSGYSRQRVNAFFEYPRLLPKSDFSPDLMLRFVSGSTARQTQGEQGTDPAADGSSAMEFVGWSSALPGVKFPAAEIRTLVSPRTERYALVSFDVLKDGLTENIRISRDNPENSLPRLATYNAIWSAQFRPRLLDGKAVAVSGMSTRFYLPSLDNAN